MNTLETPVQATDDSSNTATEAPPPPAPAGFWTLRHVVIGLVILIVLVMLMFRSCGSDKPQDTSSEEAKQKQPQQAVTVQVPVDQALTESSQALIPRRYNYAPSAGGNPWSVRSQPHSYGSYQSQSWGRLQPSRSQSYRLPPAGNAQYRPQEQPQISARPAVQPQQYYPAAPYNNFSGNSFGVPTYPYGSAYSPGYYNPGMYAVPGGYAPGWSGYR